MTLALFLMLATSLAPQAERFDAFEKTIPELQDAMERGDVTSVELVRQYFTRIEAFDQRGPKLNAMIYLNPRALDDAAALDRERHEQGPRGPLHGIPVILKDNYDMPTTGGSIALAGHVPDVELSMSKRSYFPKNDSGILVVRSRSRWDKGARVGGLLSRCVGE